MSEVSLKAETYTFEEIHEQAELGLASENALKVTEMALEPAVAYPTLEFRHGPIAVLSADTLVMITPVKAEVPYLPTLVNEIHE